MERTQKSVAPGLAKTRMIPKNIIFYLTDVLSDILYVIPPFGFCYSELNSFHSVHKAVDVTVPR